MKFFNYYLTLIVLFVSGVAVSQIQCAVDVTILEGATIAMCADAPMSISASNGYTAYAWTGPETLTGQTITPQFSGTYTVAATDASNCISTASIVVTVNPSPTPSIISSEGNLICPSVGTILSTANTYAAYDWGNGNTNPTLSVNSTGTYAVTVTDGKNCKGQANIQINTFNFTLTSSSAAACTGSNVTLTATGGTSYAWSTGEFGGSIIVAPSTPTNYSVDITAGSCTETKSILLQPVEIDPYDLEDTVYVKPNQDYFLSGPDGFTSYTWSPDNQIDSPFSQGVTFTGTESQTITINATHPSGCTITDSVVMIVVDLSIPNGFSPNGDAYNEYFVIPELTTDSLKASIAIWNRWGELVVETDDYKNDWNGRCRTDLCLGKKELPEGTYFYHLNVHDVTFKGYITLKR